MKLQEYLKINNHTQMSFIKEIYDKENVRIPQGTLAKWITGVRIPRKREMLLLIRITDGLVTPNDFYI